MVGFVVCLCTLVAQPQGVLSTLKKEHPYLLANSQDFARIKREVRTDSAMKSMFEALQKKADSLLNEPPSEYVIPDGKRLLATSRRITDRVTLLAMVYRIDGSRKYLDRAWQELKAAADFKDWNPSHFLDTAEMTHAFAIGYDWLYNDLTEEQRRTLKDSIRDRGIKKAIEQHRQKAFWTRCNHNWNQVCNGGVGIGALAIGNEEPELAQQFLALAKDAIQNPMKEYAPNGAWGEGPGYWEYATSFNVYFLAALETALGTDFGLSAIEGFSEAGTFPIYTSGPTGLSFAYADAHEGIVRAANLFWLAKKFNRPEYAVYQANTGTPQPYSLIWYDAKLAKAKTKPTLDKLYRHSEVVTMRGSWADPNTTFVAFKAGDNKFNHSHLDIGHFSIDSQGLRWASDLGSDDYNLPAYFGNKRWTYYRLRAECHNTLVLNPSDAPDQDPRAAAKVVKFSSKASNPFAIADLTPAYRNNAKSVRRGVMLVDRERILIQDEIVSERVTDTYWFMTTPAEIVIAEDGKMATLKQKGKTMTVRLLSPTSARFEAMKCEPLPSSPHPPKQADNKQMKLVVRTEVLGAKTIAVLVSPDETSKPELKPLDRW